MSDWIPVSKQLPVEGQFILAFGPRLGAHVYGPSMDICRWDGQLWDEGGTEIAVFSTDDLGFTHWMPLPDPPKTE